MADRVQKILAQAGYGSRRQCEQFILDGRVRVNGKVAELGQKADSEHDEITVDGKRVEPERLIYIMLHKPKGVLSSTEDELNQDRQTVRDLVNVPGHLYPVGRLDRQSTGLILLTNDGDLAHKLTHPRYGHEKEYVALVEGHPTAATLDQWQNGVHLDGKLTMPVRISVVRSDKKKTQLRIVMREGRKRQIRRVSSQLGHPVRQLRRERLASLKLEGLAPGEWRYLTESELRALRQSVAHNSRQPRPAQRKRIGKKRGPTRGGPRRRTDSR
jgi:pseudouridine synthase